MAVSNVQVNSRLLRPRALHVEAPDIPDSEALASYPIATANRPPGVATRVCVPHALVRRSGRGHVAELALMREGRKGLSESSELLTPTMNRQRM